MAEISSPVVANFRRRRTTFSVDIEKIMEETRNGLRQRVLVNQALAAETKYQRWLRRGGWNGTNQGTRPEGAVYMELERLGYRAPESRPPGFDFEFAPLDPLLDDFDLWFTLPPTIIRVQGEYFHYGDAATIAKDELQRKQAETLGFVVVDILAQDTLDPQRLQQVVALAILGYEVDRDGKMQVFK